MSIRPKWHKHRNTPFIKTEAEAIAAARAWRTIYPDEMKNPGFTWTPLTQENDPKDTHHDRIDFVYFRGKGLKLNGVEIVGENKRNADVVVSPYPSDHRAVVASFTLRKTLH